MAIFLKGALVTFLPGSDQRSVITFQLNPETVTHALTAADGTPVERFSFSLLLDSTVTAPGSGPAGAVQSQLSALEALLFPADLQAAPRGVLFCWGRQRVPVRVTALIVTANGFDSQLNTIRAEVEITLVALTPAEIAVLPAPMGGIANAAYTQLAQSRIQALVTAQTVTDPGQSSGGGIL